LELDHFTTARMGWRTRYARVYEEPRELDVFVLSEDSERIRFGMVNQTKKQLISWLMAALISNADCMQDRAGYGIWSGNVLKRFSKAQPAGRQLFRALPAYIAPNPEEDEEPEPSEVSGLSQAFSRLPYDHRCLVFVISDDLSRAPADLQALEEAGSLHDVVFLAVADQREQELPEGSGFRDIDDLTSGRTSSVYLSEQTRETWRQEFDRRREELRASLSDAGIAMEEFFTHETPEELNDKLLPIIGGYRPL